MTETDPSLEIGKNPLQILKQIGFTHQLAIMF